MAFTWTVSKKDTHGSEHVQHGVVVADATTGAVATGFGTINQVHYAPKSQTSGVKFRINAGAAGTATAGTLAITGCTSGDEFFVTVYGR